MEGKNNMNGFFLMSLMMLVAFFAPFLQAQNLRICALHDPPNLLIDNTTGTPAYSGFYYDLIQLVFQTAGYSPNYTFYVVPDNNFGSLSNGTWNGAMGELLYGRADIFMGLLNPTLSRFNSGVQFSRAVQEGGFAVMVRKPKEQVNTWSIFAPFTIQLWILILCTTVAMSFLFYIMDRLSPYGFYYQDEKDQRVQARYREMIHNSFMGVMGKDTSYGNSVSFRLLQGFFFFFSLILLATYTANLTTFLLAGQAAPVVTSIDDIKKQGIKFTTVVNSAAASYFNLPQNVAFKPTLVLTNSTTQALQYLTNGTVDAFVWTSIVLDYFTNQPPCDTLIVGKTDLKQKAYYGIPFSNSTDPLLVRNISTAILTIIQNGQLDTLFAKWKNILSSGCPDTSNDGSNNLDVTNLQGLFYVLLIGIGMSFLGVIGELIFRKFIYRPGNKFLKIIHNFLGGDSERHVKRFSRGDLRKSKRNDSIPLDNKDKGNVQI